jgi:prepilin-type N-terminal cleavage/methylation domain-containing protein
MIMEPKRAFTLIEMLIVVVIIGILAAALIPRLQSVQGRARDTKRKADLSQIGSSLAIYKSDIGSFTGLVNGTTSIASGGAATGVSYLTAPLVTNGSYLTAMPIESDLTAWNVLWANTVTGYAFAPLMRNGIAAGWFLLAARTETDGSSSNWVTPGTASAIGVYSGTTAGALVALQDATLYEGSICSRVVAGTAASRLPSGNTVCYALKTANDLRYVYTQ